MQFALTIELVEAAMNIEFVEYRISFFSSEIRARIYQLSISQPLQVFLFFWHSP